MAKEISGFIKLQIKGGQTNSAPLVGPSVRTTWSKYYGIL